MTARHFVKDGHTLGYTLDAQPGWFHVLHGSVLRGGHDWKDGPVVLSPGDRLVAATLADFEAYRVCPKGHLPEPVAA